jgi:uncharacterized protein (TIGR03083 family)
MELAARAESIRNDSDALADAAAGHLDVTIPSCPDWTMQDLVQHVHQVQRSWYRIISERLTEPDWADDPQPTGDELIDELRANAHRFADLLARTDPDTPCWTWGPTQTAGFHQRFQVQETALHRWDAQDAVGDAEPIGTEGAADAIVMFAELLPMAVPDPAHGFDVEIVDDPAGTRVVPVLHAPGRPVAGTLRGRASDLLLVLWKRTPVASVEATGDVDAIRATLEAVNFG